MTIDPEPATDQRQSVALLKRLEESCAQGDRGEGYNEEELRARMAERRSERV